MIFATFAAMAVTRLHLRVDDAWSATETVSLALPDEPATIIEEDHYRLTCKVIEAGPDSYTVEVGRLMTESIVDGQKVPGPKDEKPDIHREIWQRGGEMDSVLADTLAEKQQLRLERPLHPPLSALMTGVAQTGGTEGVPVTAKWLRRKLADLRDGERWELIFEEQGTDKPQRATETLTLNAVTGLATEVDAQLENAIARGGQAPLRIHIVRHLDKLPTRS